jgi:hypothetical protein
MDIVVIKDLAVKTQAIFLCNQLLCRIDHNIPSQSEYIRTHMRTHARTHTKPWLFPAVQLSGLFQLTALSLFLPPSLSPFPSPTVLHAFLWFSSFLWKGFIIIVRDPYPCLGERVCLGPLCMCVCMCVRSLGWNREY